jgi:hypothetical protein
MLLITSIKISSSHIHLWLTHWNPQGSHIKILDLPTCPAHSNSPNLFVWDGGHTDITLVVWWGHLKPLEKLQHFIWMAIKSQEINSSLTAAPIHPPTHASVMYFIHSSLHTYIHPFIHPPMHARIHTHIHTHKHTPTYVHAYLHTYTRIYIH